MTFDIRKALVTGGAGFIGSHLVEALIRDGCTVTVLDNLATGHLDNLESVKNQVTFIKGDIEDEELLDKITPACDVVFHQAAVVSVVQTVKDPVFSAQVNDLGAVKVLDAARRNNVRRVVMASSSAVYGDSRESPKTESMMPAPLSPYAVQKLTNEYNAALYHRLYGVETVCLRYFNVFGPRQDPSSPYSGVISIFMKQALDRRPPLIYGDGHQTRDFVFVNDVVRANLLAATRDSAPGQVLNVGTGLSVEIKVLWKMVADMAECTFEAQYRDPREGDIKQSLASIQRAGNLLGFEPAVSLEEGLRQTYDWYRKGYEKD